MSDYIIVHTENFGPQIFLLEDLKLEWPPPERLALGLEGIREVRETDPPAFILLQVFILEGPYARTATYEYETTYEQDAIFGPNHSDVVTRSSPEREEVFNKLAELSELQKPSTLTLKKDE